MIKRRTLLEIPVRNWDKAVRKLDSISHKRCNYKMKKDLTLKPELTSIKN
jgi:hypothetical protein